MYDRWDLDVLYPGCDSPAYTADVEKLTSLCGELPVLCGQAGKMEDGAFVKQYLLLSEQLTEVAQKLLGYLSLRRAVNAADEEAGSQYGRLMAKLSATAGPDATARKYIGDLPDLMALADRDALLGEYRYLLQNMQQDAAHLLGGREEEILARFNLSGADAWSDLRDYLTSSVPVEFRGEKTNLSDIRNKAYDADADVRREAYEAELACYDRIRDSVAFALNSIKLAALDTAELRGYASVLDRTLAQSHMRRETLDALLEAMVEYMPHFHRYLRAKARLLGKEGGLPFYDLFAPVGENDLDFTPESARAYLHEVFSAFDGELAGMIERAFTENWIDFYPREGKTGGAFCAEVRSVGQSRVLTNFGGKFTDVMTLAHELGHAFHNSNIFDHRPLNNDYSMPVAETASNFNEVLVMDYALRHAGSKREKLALLEGKLSDTTQIICDIYSRYLFESAVLASRKEDFLFPDRLCAMMLDAQKQAYGDGLDENALHPYMWVCKSHYYSAGLSFYNWPYAFGGLFAQGLFARYGEMGEAFVPKYKEMLHRTTVTDVEGTAAIMGIDLTDPAFWRKGLDCFVGMIDEFVALAEEK